jgi:hypothetical protein
VDLNREANHEVPLKKRCLSKYSRYALRIRGEKVEKLPQFLCLYVNE